jgi:hypothetical protein
LGGCGGLAVGGLKIKKIKKGPGFHQIPGKKGKMSKGAITHYEDANFKRFLSSVNVIKPFFFGIDALAYYSLQ